MAKYLLGLVITVFAGLAQGGNVSGIVTDTGGAAISGAIIRMEKGGQTATTANDGSFTLTGISAEKGLVNSFNPHGLEVLAQGGRLIIYVRELSRVSVTGLTAQGRVICHSRQTMEAGKHALAFNGTATGVYFYRVRTDKEEVVLKAVLINGASAGSATSRLRLSPHVLSKSAKIAEVINDVLAATKTGFLDYRMAVSNPDTGGIEVKMMVCEGIMSDTDGNTYQTVRIGSQVWMAGNLRTTRLNDGTPIPLDTLSETWYNAYFAEYCFYNNTADTDSITKYGALYNWYAAGSGTLAPAGWRVPDDSDWNALYDYLVANGYNYDGTATGNKVAKSLAAMCDWNASGNAGEIGNNQTGNNWSGFTALPAGYRNWDGGFLSMDFNGYWWSATPFDNLYANMRNLSSGSEYFTMTNRYSKNCGFSIRLVKDN